MVNGLAGLFAMLPVLVTYWLKILGTSFGDFLLGRLKVLPTFIWVFLATRIALL